MDTVIVLIATLFFLSCVAAILVLEFVVEHIVPISAVLAAWFLVRYLNLI